MDKSELHQLMSKHEGFIFHNGYHKLILRNPDSNDYTAFDDHGLIFIYTNQDYSEVLENLGADYKPNEKLIYKLNH